MLSSMDVPDPADASAVERVRGELSELSAAAIDASSMIYMLKAGFFGYAAAELDFFTAGPVAAEVGWPQLPVRIVDLRRGGEVPWTPDTVEIPEAYVDSTHRTNDELLLDLARRRGLALVSEDRGLLERAAEAGRRHYNALLLLALVHRRGRLDRAEYAEYADRLEQIGRYSSEVVSFARAVAAPESAASESAAPESAAPGHSESEPDGPGSR